MQMRPLHSFRIPLRAAVAGLSAFLLLTGCKESATETDPPTEAIQLVPGTVVGKKVFPIGNTAQGGQGQTVSGLSCIETVASHSHTHLSLFVNGEQIAIPLGIGITDVREQNGFAAAGSANSCLYLIHTHDATGILHVEPPTKSTKLTLGQAFDLWGQPIDRNNVAGFMGTVTAYIDRKQYTGDLRAITLDPGKQINLQVGAPLVQPPAYILPQGL